MYCGQVWVCYYLQVEGTVAAVVGTEAVEEVGTTVVAAQTVVVGQHRVAADGAATAERKHRTPVVYCQTLTSTTAVEVPTVPTS